MSEKCPKCGADSAGPMMNPQRSGTQYKCVSSLGDGGKFCQSLQCKDNQIAALKEQLAEAEAKGRRAGLEEAAEICRFLAEAAEGDSPDAPNGTAAFAAEAEIAKRLAEPAERKRMIAKHGESGGLLTCVVARYEDDSEIVLDDVEDKIAALEAENDFLRTGDNIRTLRALMDISNEIGVSYQGRPQATAREVISVLDMLHNQLSEVEGERDELEQREDEIAEGELMVPCLTCNGTGKVRPNFTQYPLQEVKLADLAAKDGEK